MTSKIYIRIFIVIILLTSKIFSMDLSLSGDYREVNKLIRYTQGISLKLDYKEPFKNPKTEYYFFTEYFNTDYGDSFTMDLQADYNLTEQWDIWYGATYRDEQNLGLPARTDWKVGGGYYFIKEMKRSYERKFKVSYGLVFRENKFLHSLRIKDSFKNYKLNLSFLKIAIGYDWMINYLSPIKGDDSNELRAVLNPFLKINSLVPSLQFKYIKTDNLSYFERRFMLKIEL